MKDAGPGSGGPAWRPPWFDPRMPASDRCVLAPLLRAAVADCPDRTFVTFANGESWTYAELAHRASRRAAGLQRLGVSPGDRVISWQPNGPDALLCWLATNLLGGCFVPLHTGFRGQVLAGAVASVRARVLVGHDELLPRLQSCSDALPSTIVATGSPAPRDLADAAVLGPACLDADNADLVLPDDPDPWDLQSILFTSGTTGTSKGVRSSYFHLCTVAEVLHGHMSPSDRILVNAPLFHVGGPGAITAALIHRGSVVLVEGFRASEFWDIVASTGCTMTSGLLGSMAPYLAKYGRMSTKSSARLRRTHFYPVSQETIAFAREFGFEYFSGYGMTELPLVLVTDVDTEVIGSCGRPRSGVQCRLVDEHDCEVPDGSAGELIVRTDHPWSFSDAYDGLPEATQRAWRNGWFHTGDLLRRDPEGNYYFVDRLKDAIRRRGENISSQEVESAIRQHNSVLDAAAVGIPSEFGEDDVLVAVSYREGYRPAPPDLLTFLQPLLPDFAWPRYVREVREFPLTPTGKIRKQVLREEGVTTDTWDRERDGSDVARRGSSARPEARSS